MTHRHAPRETRLKTRHAKDQLPKFLYDQIPTVTNKSDLNSCISSSIDSPYSSIMMKTRVTPPTTSTTTKGSTSKSPKAVRNASSPSSNQTVSPKVSRDNVRKKLTLDTAAINNSPSTGSSIPVKIPNNGNSTNNNNRSTSNNTTNYNSAQSNSSNMQPDHRRLSIELPAKVIDFRKSVSIEDKDCRRINSEKLPDFRKLSNSSDRGLSATSDRKTSGNDRKPSSNSFMSDYRRRSSAETSSPAKIPDHRISSGESFSSATPYSLDVPTSTSRKTSSGNSPLYDLGEKYFSILGHTEHPLSKSPDISQQAIATTNQQQLDSSQTSSHLRLPDQIYSDTLAVVPEDKSLDSIISTPLKDEFSFEIHPVKKTQVHFNSSSSTPASLDKQLGVSMPNLETSTATLKDEKSEEIPEESWKDEWKEADDEDEEDGVNITAMELNTNRKRIHRGLHSNSSSISWTPTNPEEWTIENIKSWLKLNDFNDTWIKGFEKIKLEKDKFLKLQSYQEIKKYSVDFDTTDAYSTPTRFVQLLRRALGRTHSSSMNIQETQIMNASPISLISETSTLDYFGHEDEFLEHLPITLDPRSMPKHKSRSVISEGNILLTVDDQYGEKLVPVVSAPVATNDDTSSISSLKKIEIERKPAAKPRPFSSFERTLYSHNAYPSNSKTVFKKHNKSTSSDSSIMASLANSLNNNNVPAPNFPLNSDNSSSGYTSPYSAKGNYHTRTASKGSVSDTNTPKQGIFNKFFGKNKVVDLPPPPKSLDVEESPISPSSSLNENNKRAKKSPFDTEKKRISAIFSTDHYYSNNYEKKKKEKEEHLRKTTLKNIPRFEKIGPVGKRPSPTGVTIPVITTSTLPSTPLPNGDQLSSIATPNLKPTNYQNSGKISTSNRLPSFTLDKKFRPVSTKSNSDIFILVSSDNISFKPVNIANFKLSSDLKNHLIESLNLSKDKETIFRLTDFGCDPGEPLDDETFTGIHDCKFFHGMSKLLLFQKKDDNSHPIQSSELHVPSSELTSIRTNSSYANSTNSEQSYEKYLTPQHMVESSKLKEGTDYLNFKETFETIQEKPDSHRRRQQQSANTSPPRRTTSVSLGRTSSLTRARSITTSNSSIDRSIKSSTNFRVIRSEKREIDFDKRRSSPFIKQEFGGSLVALRIAPPPPSNNNSTESLVSGKSIKNRKPPPAGVLGTSAAAEMDNGLNRQDSLKRYLSITRKSTIKRRPTQSSARRRRSFDPFRENEIVFSKIDDESDSSEDEESDDSDDGLFAKVPKASPQNTNSSAANTSIQASLSSSLRDNRTAKSSDIEKDTDTFLSSSTESSLDIRPPPEVVLDHLEVYFPNADLDKLIINEVVTPPVSPIAESPIGSATTTTIGSKKHHRQNSSIASSIQSKSENLTIPENSSGRMHRMKSIRIVAQEAKRKAEREQKSMGGSLLRRKSTKMWGQRLVEVKPGSASSKYVNKLRDQQGKYKEFAWVKGELIGSGSFGKVYLALNVTTGDMIAVKQIIISTRFLNNKETKEKVDTFKAEVDSLKDLDHNNIVQYLGFEMKGGTYSIFLEYVSGGSVGHLIRTYGKFTEQLASNLTRQVLEGLSYIHSKGILHRDLKADNLLLETNGVCKISDFGISKKAQDIYNNDSAMSFQGTVFWMAPELVKNSGYNAKVDIWSLGCVVFEMFSGKRPWHDFEYVGAIFKLGSKCAPPIPEETKKELSAKSAAFLDRCFSVDPDDRPTASELVSDAFCDRSPDFKFEETELGKKMRFNDKLSERKAEMILKSKEG